MKKLNRLAIFDLDGTLVDSLDDLVLSANEARRFFKLPPLPKEEIASFVGDGMVMFVKRLFNGAPVELEEGIKKVKEEYSLHLTDNTRFYKGMPECVNRLKKAGFKVGILSNKTEKFSRMVIEQLRMIEAFDFIYGGDSFDEKKPSPLPIIKILEEFKGDRRESFMIGDSCNDILSGKKAGIKTIAVVFGFNGTSHLRECKADFTAHTPDDVCKIILG